MIQRSIDRQRRSEVVRKSLNLFEWSSIPQRFSVPVQSWFGSRICVQLTSNNSLQFHPIEFPCFLSFYKMSDPFLIDESRIQVWRNSIPNCFVVRTRLFIDFSNASVISGRNRTPGPCQTSKGRQWTLRMI